MQHGRRGEPLPILKAVHVDDGARLCVAIRYGRDEYTAAPANEEVGGAGAEPIILDERPVIRPTSNSPSGSETMRGAWLRQKLQVQVRTGLSSGALVSRKRT